MEKDILEKDILIDMKDARIHFAVNCASAGCPPLLNEAFYSEDLDLQLDEVSQFLVNHPDYVRIKSKSIEVSKIFKWYSGDFKKDKAGKYNSVASFVDYYLRDSNKPSFDIKKLGFLGIKHYDYSWELNEQG